MCKDVYGETKMSKGRAVLFWSLMHTLFTEYNTTNLQEPRRDYQEQIEQCGNNLEICLYCLDLFLPASLENIKALIMAGLWFVKTDRPSRGRAVTAAAANMCVALGYHRYATIDDNDEERESKIGCFWQVYLMDKQLSLRLGRSSTLQDWDILHPPIETSTTASGQMTPNMRYWVDLARVQGLTYEKLYSPLALQQNTSDRTATARHLAFQMEEVYLKHEKVRSTTHPPCNCTRCRSRYPHG
jgi:hypothetical protein